MMLQLSLLIRRFKPDQACKPSLAILSLAILSLAVLSLPGLAWLKFL